MKGTFGTIDVLRVLQAAFDGTASYEELLGSLLKSIEARRGSGTDELIRLLIQLDQGKEDRSADKDALAFMWRKLAGLPEPETQLDGLREFRGSLGFFAGSLTLLDGNADSAREFFRDPDCRAFIHYSYGVPDEILEHFTPYCFGTTSLIFRCGQNGEHVLKLLRLKFIDNHALAAQFSKYRDEFGNAPSSPTVHDCGRGWILMDFIKGETLRNYIDTTMWKAHRRALSTGRSTGIQRKAEFECLEMIKGVSTSLLSVLSELEAADMTHHDLSPSNIMVSRKGTQIHLIDFGANQLLSSGIGSPTEVGDLQVYACPELLSGHSHGALSDAYSLGVILLECCIGKQVSAETLQGHLDDVWLRMPDLAMIIDDCLTQDPEYRALDYRSRKGSAAGSAAGDADDAVAEHGIFHAMRSRAVAALSNLEADASQSRIREILGLSVNSGNYILNVASKISGRQDNADPDSYWMTNDRKLDTWKRVCLTAFGFCMVLVPYSILREGLDGWGSILRLRQYFGIEPFTLLSSLPGRIVCLSFTLTAAIYYANIFQSVDIYDDKRDDPKNIRVYRVSRFWLRFNAFCFSLPILWALVVDPLAWPYCAALGLFFVGMNNHWATRAARTARGSLTDAFRVRLSRSVDATIDLFSRWARLVFLYAAGLVGIGLFLWYQRDVASLDVLSVELFFAVAIVAVNYLKMQRENCTMLAPSVRKMLMHIFLSHKRMRDASMINFDETAERLRSIAEWLRAGDRELDIDAVLICTRQRGDLVSYVEAIEAEGVSVSWNSAGDGKRAFELPKAAATAIVVSPRRTSELPSGGREQ